MSLNQSVRLDHATMQQDDLLLFYTEMRLKYEKDTLLSSSRAFLLSTPMENSEATWKKATKCNKHIPWQISEYINNSNKIDIFTLNMFCLHGNHKKTMHKKWLKVLGQIVMHNPSAPVIFISQKAFLWASFLLIKMPLLYTITRKNEVEEL